jgi:4-hydroxy-2-oxoheptanedioate aldolase
MNAMRQAWANGEPSIGVGGPTTPLEAERLGAAGYDWVWFDMQHSPIGFETLLSLIQAVELGGTRAVVRPSWNEPSAIMRPLDLGAIGLLIPMVSSAAEAAEAAQAMRYPPAGYRSWGPLRHAFDSPSEANDDVVCVAMIETISGLEHADEIAAVPGVDVLFTPPSDLALALGRHPHDFYEAPAETLAHARRMVEATAAHGKVAGAVSFDPDYTEALLEIGVRWIVTSPVVDPPSRLADWKRRFGRPRQPR